MASKGDIWKCESISIQTQIILKDLHPLPSFQVRFFSFQKTTHQSYRSIGSDLKANVLKGRTATPGSYLSRLSLLRDTLNNND